ncbi:MAG: hypothetical protein E7289_07965 [Lachnospiraceae bacterium]|nr:hypothetical protein [Lachnospiraceae bacterium]
MIEDFILWIFLGINTITDMRNRSIYVAITLLFGIVEIAMFVCGEKTEVFSLAGGMMAGVCLMMFSALTRGAVGFGDGLVVSVAGIRLGGGKTMLVLMGGFLLVIVTGIVGICVGKMNRKTEIPFVPFFTLSYALFYIGGLL